MLMYTFLLSDQHHKASVRPIAELPIAMSVTILFLLFLMIIYHILIHI